MRQLCDKYTCLEKQMLLCKKKRKKKDNYSASYQESDALIVKTWEAKWIIESDETLDESEIHKDTPWNNINPPH